MTFPVQSLETSNFPTLGGIRRLDPALDRLLDPEVKVQVIASGFAWSEGPVWIPEGRHLLFSDIPRNAIYRWKEGEGVSLFMQPSGYTGVVEYGWEPGSNGLTLDPQGRLALCEHGDRRVSLLHADGGKQTLADRYEGKRLNSPNDCVFDAQGNLFFTDPPYGLPGNFDDFRRELDFCGVYRLSRDGELSLLTGELTRPNGLAFSPDGATLYVANSDPDRAIWRAYPVGKGGTLGPGRDFYDATEDVGKGPGLPDGLKVDREGNLWATGPGGVNVFSPAGMLLGRIELGEAASNCAWGDDGSTLYITADMYVCRVRTKTKGNGW
jgi:gluconolactonase